MYINNTLFGLVRVSVESGILQNETLTVEVVRVAFFLLCLRGRVENRWSDNVRKFKERNHVSKRLHGVVR